MINLVLFNGLFLILQFFFAGENCDFAPNLERVVKDRLPLLLWLLDIYTDRRLAYRDTFQLCVAFSCSTEHLYDEHCNLALKLAHVTKDSKSSCLIQPAYGVLQL